MRASLCCSGIAPLRILCTLPGLARWWLGPLGRPDIRSIEPCSGTARPHTEYRRSDFRRLRRYSDQRYKLYTVWHLIHPDACQMHSCDSRALWFDPAVLSISQSCRVCSENVRRCQRWENICLRHNQYSLIHEYCQCFLDTDQLGTTRTMWIVFEVGTDQLGIQHTLYALFHSDTSPQDIRYRLLLPLHWNLLPHRGRTYLAHTQRNQNFHMSLVWSAYHCCI